MFPACLFCSTRFDPNQVVEALPVGRRIAFDQKRGRLWVVCRHCERWNLTPLDERWEAIEACERRFRDARKRVTSENIGLARLAEGLELVRIGEPLRPEFAAWRYGDQFGRRRRRTALAVGGLVAVGGGLAIAASVTGLMTGAGYALWHGTTGIWDSVQRRRIAVRIPVSPGATISVRGRHLQRICLHSAKGPDEWGIHVPHDHGVELFHGEAARQAAALIMPRLNAAGASQRKVAEAVAQIEACGDPASFLAELARSMSPDARRRNEHGLLNGLVVETRLAIEMAVNEENERYALEGELALLELEWKEAEELAAISDQLLPDSLVQQLEALKRR